jgi:hypothetical protein
LRTDGGLFDPTTIVNLLMRFYEIDQGRITVDGIVTREMTGDSSGTKTRSGRPAVFVDKPTKEIPSFDRRHAQGLLDRCETIGDP